MRYPLDLGVGATTGAQPALLGAGHPDRGRGYWDLRPPQAGWTLAAVTAVIAGATPLAGRWWWLPSFAAVAVCLLMAVPWRSSLLGTAALIAAQAPLAVAFPAADWPDAPAARQKEIIAVAAEGSAQLADRLDVAFDLEADSHRV